MYVVHRRVDLGMGIFIWLRRLIQDELGRDVWGIDDDVAF